MKGANLWLHRPYKPTNYRILQYTAYVHVLRNYYTLQGVVNNAQPSLKNYLVDHLPPSLRRYPQYQSTHNSLSGIIAKVQNWQSINRAVAIKTLAPTLLLSGVRCVS